MHRQNLDNLDHRRGPKYDPPSGGGAKALNAYKVVVNFDDGRPPTVIETTDRNLALVNFEASIDRSKNVANVYLAAVPHIGSAPPKRQRPKQPEPEPEPEYDDDDDEEEEEALEEEEEQVDWQRLYEQERRKRQPSPPKKNVKRPPQMTKAQEERERKLEWSRRQEEEERHRKGEEEEPLVAPVQKRIRKRELEKSDIDDVKRLEASIKEMEQAPAEDDPEGFNKRSAYSVIVDKLDELLQTVDLKEHMDLASEWKGLLRRYSASGSRKRKDSSMYDVE